MFCIKIIGENLPRTGVAIAGFLTVGIMSSIVGARIESEKNAKNLTLIIQNVSLALAIMSAMYILLKRGKGMLDVAAVAVLSSVLFICTSVSIYRQNDENPETSAKLLPIQFSSAFSWIAFACLFVLYVYQIGAC